MSDEAFFPENERPRYLLPDGCKDLIDVLRASKSYPKFQAIHGSGKPLEPLTGFAGSTSVPMSLSELPQYIRQFFESEKEDSYLMISPDDWCSTVATLRTNGRLELQCTLESAMAEKIRPVAASLSLQITADEEVDPGAKRRVVFLLPASRGLVTQFCLILLSLCFEWQPSADLFFDLFNFE